MNDSPTTHGVLTEPSHREGKGREGKGKGRWLLFIHDLRLLAIPVMDGGFAASNGAA